jgi:tRNA modification GTPase
MLTDSNAPIAAIATASGRGGIGVIRVSGGDLTTVIGAVLGEPAARRLLPRAALYTPFLDADGGEIDRGLALFFPAPHSYTGEAVLELQGHGGPVVMQMLLARVLRAGAPLGLRLAEPGEFTQRAFLNDKLDLAQAEAVADLIDASTEQAARSATRSLAGVFSRAVHQLVEALVNLRMLVEATLDFPEEEIDFLERADALGQLGRLRAQLDTLLAQARRGALLRNGLDVVLVGEPNVGKSSLLNALAGAEVAIVTPIAGTTRDRVTQAIQIEGVPLNIIDTAGLRETTDEIERIGIERTWQAVAQADVVLHLVSAEGQGGSVGEGSGGDGTGEAVAGASIGIAPELLARLPRGVPIVRVVNKIDLAGQGARVERNADGTTVESVWLSARAGDGIDALRAALLELAGWQQAGESTFIARERHLLALRAAQDHLAVAEQNALARAQQLDLFAEELRLAQEQLNAITGEFSADDLLGVIFSRFCIGK